MSTPTDTPLVVGDTRVYDPATGEYGTYMGRCVPDRTIWVWFDPDSEPSPVPLDSVEVL